MGTDPLPLWGNGVMIPFSLIPFSRAIRLNCSVNLQLLGRILYKKLIDLFFIILYICLDIITSTMKKIIFLILILVGTLTYGQNINSKQFESYATKQDSLFINAYNKRDINTYQGLLKDFLSKYNSLSDAEKKTYSGNLSNAYYNLCCTYSLLDKKEMALTYLKKTIASGYTNYTHLKEDTDLVKIRNQNEFKTIVEPLRKIGDYLYILKKAGKYNTGDRREIPKFTYQSKDNPNLVTLRKAFKLDSIAGEGNDVSKMINLMQWIHNLVPHDGNHGNPVVKNAMSMIAECKRGNRGLNCRGMATVLNECFLSMGFKSRIVTCLPKDSLKTDNDCHVIDVVYSNLLKKWVWIDPTFAAYVMNEKGELLSIEEVRGRIITNQPLILNPDANWNKKNSQTKEYYLYKYMAKNLYILECPLNSEYNMETMEAGKVISYIRLLPLDYFNQLPDKVESNGPLTKFVYYKTNNPQVFWQK